mmetsp:Transcript_35831/g.70494  ORF Transcript_35831/g.70494 Transcript_35831/m.70494 type:complete len:120 (-) Transcript_35831:86-445(-)|eukprot:CAMPEP_0194306636 /NCGR_PEP_ID=MMETSP0171-20130528/3710_1 /TAXON_ID=218684 /ORGANISM="Corethron pennatum, Strain L29A3" /LENGTH=119 /DNA_ID=CAMNT_0039058447 /DNA_START=65 /DNA_END=424 /DNA_ORIENTATION=+
MDNKKFLAAILLCITSSSQLANAWTHQSSTPHSIREISLHAAPSDAAGDAAPPPEPFRNEPFGVSYIGGDPCGSRYNDDPFDSSSGKNPEPPGFPKDMKARIAAMAEERRKCEEEASEG